MTISFQEEVLKEARHDLEQCLGQHWQEIAQDQDKMPLDVDWLSYELLETTGKFCLITARENGVLIGYASYFLHPHIHYKQTLCAHSDVYYLKPTYRRSHVGQQLFAASEMVLKARGVQKLFAGMKVYKMAPDFFRKMGWTETEVLYTKWIGDS